MDTEDQSRIIFNAQAFLPSHGLKWLNVSGFNSLWIGVIYFFLVAGIFFLIETNVGEASFPSELKWAVASIGTVFLTIWLTLTRGAVKDLVDIASYAGAGFLEVNTTLGQPSYLFRIVELFSGIALGYTISFSGRAFSEGVSLSSAFFSPLIDFKAGFFAGLYSTFVSLIFIFAGICIIRTITFLYRQINLFYKVANTIPIDLLNPQPLAVFATQPLRVFFGLVGITATIPFTLSSSQGLANTVIPIGIPLICMVLILFLLVSIPLTRIRSRLKQAKIQESELITKALTGNRLALNKSRISVHQDEFKMPDLLYYQDRIQAVWEWPLHNHIRRIAFYVVLPPLAWTLENLLQSAL